MVETGRHQPLCCLSDVSCQCPSSVYHRPIRLLPISCQTRQQHLAATVWPVQSDSVLPVKTRLVSTKWMSPNFLTLNYNMCTVIVKFIFCRNVPCHYAPAVQTACLISDGKVTDRLICWYISNSAHKWWCCFKKKTWKSWSPDFLTQKWMTMIGHFALNYIFQLICIEPKLSCGFWRWKCKRYADTATFTLAYVLWWIILGGFPENRRQVAVTQHSSYSQNTCWAAYTLAWLNVICCVRTCNWNVVHCQHFVDLSA